MRKVTYKTESQREKAMSEAIAKGEILVEDAILTNEKYLIFDITEEYNPSLQDIDQQIIDKIREQYDINSEFKMINLGIADSTNVEYLAYRQHVEDCKEWGRQEKIKYGYLSE